MALAISVSGWWIHCFGVCSEVQHHVRESGGRVKLLTTGQKGGREGARGTNVLFKVIL